MDIQGYEKKLQVENGEIQGDATLHHDFTWGADRAGSFLSRGIRKVA